MGTFVAYKCSNPSRWTVRKPAFVKSLTKYLHFTVRKPSKAANKVVIVPNDWTSPPLVCHWGEETNRINPGMFTTEEKVVESVVRELDKAINYHQTEYIAEARRSLQTVFQMLSMADAPRFEFPTGYGRQVLERGKELFLKDGVSCSVKHGILLLDSSNNSAHFYVGLLNLVGAFAVTISEYQIGEEIFALLISLHRKSNVTTHLRDLGAAFNNAGCISLIKGDLKQAEINFQASLKNLKSAEKLQWPHSVNLSAERVQRSRNSSLDVMLIAVESNVSRLFLMSRDFGSALVKQEQIVESCKAQNSALPIEEVFTVMNNQAILHTTLTNFEKAEEALEWLRGYCIEMKREECDFLLNFVSLHLCEVLLLFGKSKEAEKVFSLSTLTSAHGTELALMFGGLHINVRTEAIEKMIDVLVLRGKVKFACSLLEKGVNILRKCFGPDHYNVASMLYKQGMILSLLGEFSDSIDKLECSVAILEEMFGTKHPLLLKVYMSLGDVALTLKREDESFLYFQRAMENIEELYQVSFVSQLSTRYVKMTQNAKHFQERRMHVMKTEGLVIDLVAEYGLAFAVVLSRVVVQRSDGYAKGLKTTGKRPLMTKGLSVQCSSTMAIISLKCTRDFLQTGQTFLRQGMTKEAAAFFQQAGEHCTAHQLLKGAPNQCLARLYGILAKKRLESREPLDDGNDLIVCLKDLNEVSTRATEDVIPVTSDCQLTLKLVLIFLIRLSIELKVIDVTFEAYELYAKLSHSDTDFMFFHNGGVQFYASRTVIKCNGKTAVQDILVSSTIGLIESDSDCSSPDQQLFRSLACKSNVPTDSFLVTYNSSTLLDIDKLQEMERKISLSVQECFQLRCFEAEKRSATQVLVDLSSKSPCKPYDIVAVGRRIELLSLCLSEEISTDVSCGGQLFEISTAMRQTMTRLTFEDEQTSHFMFCKNALLILEQCNPRNISTVSVERHCLSLTITHPVKARLTLWHKNRCIAQKLQLIQTTRRNDPADWMMPQQAFPEVPGGSYCVADGFIGPTIDHLAKKYRVAFEIDISCIDVPLDDSNASCGQNGFPLDEQQSQETRLNTLSQEYEDNETLRICLNESVLEGLTAVSEISRHLYGGVTPEDVDGGFIEVAPEDVVVTDRFPSFSESQLQQQSISSQMNLNSQDETETHNSTLEAPHSIAVKEDPWTREENSMSKTNDDDKELGRSLFEKDRSSRRSFIAELQENLKRKQSPNDPNFVKPEEAMQNCSDVATDTAQASHVVKSDDSPTHIDLTFSGVETPRFHAEDESKTQSLSESWSQDKNARTAEDENASRLDRNRNSKRPSTAILKDQEPEMEKPSQNSSSLEYVSSLTDEIIPGKQDCEDERHPDDSQKDESSPDPEASCQVAQEEYTRNTYGTSVKNLISKGAVNDPDLYQSDTSSSVQDQTQHQHQISLHELHRSRACNPAYVDAKANGPIEGVNDHGQSKRYKEEVRESHDENEPLRRRESHQISPMTEATSGSSFQFDDIVPDGPSTGTSQRAQSNANHFMPLPNTDAVDRPLGGIGTNIRAKPVSKKETGVEAPRNGSQNTKRSQLLNKANKNTAIFPQFCEFLGGDVLVDGNTTYISHNKEDVVDGPVKICQDGGNKLSVNEASSFQFDVARDVVDAPVHFPKVDTKINNKPSDFGGARPKERSANTIKSTSTSNTGLTQPSTAYQYEATETPGIHLDFWKRHAVNGSTLEAPFQEGYGDHYFSAKGVPCNENLRAPWELFSQPSYHSEGTFFELFGKGGHANIRFSRGDGQSLLGHQKPSLPQNESWHFPPPETDETIAMQSKYYDGQKCARRRNSTQLDYFGSNEEALFNSDNSQSEVLYTEMDSMTNEYHSGAGKIDNGPAQSSAVIASQQSSTEDCTSSLLGSLQHIMAKTVKLIASDKAVEKQPKEQKERQKQKELEKLGIQEEAREGNEEEHAVRSRVEDSIIQVETRQENEPAPETESQSIPTPVQESPRPVCSHYQRRCLVRFPCCGKFFPCHRCHNESEDCSDDQARAINATHIRCTICFHEQAIDEHSQTCSECKSKMSEYFCPNCKHFTSVDKNPFHCDKCGICRIHRDRSFHCDVCNVCLDKRLQGKHKCRPDSGHDECCICLEDAFSGCQILPCSHKVHKDCAIAMIQNGVRTCPICRHPLFSQPQNNSN